MINPGAYCTLNMYNLRCALFLLVSIESIHVYGANNATDWDLLIFTQNWPLSVCLQWKEQFPNHTCAFPQENTTWTVHGVWPTKLGTKGPQFCNSSLHFNRTELDTIKEEMEQEWTNVHNSSEFEFWKHEWKKHGTCAAQLPTLDTELKYFGQGLAWVMQYEMRDILSKLNIVPSNQGYTLQNVSDAVTGALGIKPQIQCIGDHKTKQSYLMEIRICFYKNLTLTNCDGVVGPIDPKTGIKTNCPGNKTIVYPTMLPPFIEERAPKELSTDTKFIVNTNPMYGKCPWPIQVLRIIQFLQKMTL